MMHEPDIVDAEYEEISDVTDTSPVNVGTIGHIDHGKSMFTDAVLDTTDIYADGYEPIDSTEYPNESNNKPKMSKTEMLEALKTAVDDGHVSGKEAKRMKRDLGIFASDFTKKKETPNKRKSKRAAQKKARRKQR